MGFLETQGIIITLVVVATLVAIVVQRIRLPYTVSLVLVGLLLTIWQPLPLEIEVTPELILVLFLPPLVFEAAFHLNFRLLRENLGPIVLLAVPGVLLGTLLVGGLVSLGTGLPLAVAATFGALIAATDPVAVVALFRALGVPRALAVAVEGESLFNDGTAIVVFQITLATALSGVFDPVRGVLDFFRIALGGLGVGVVLGWLTAQLLGRLEDRLVVSMLTTLLAYGSYLAAEQFHVSGVLAVVAAGLLCGNVGLARATPSTKIMLFTLWEFIAFLANSLVFLLIGLAVDLAQLRGHLTPIGVAVGAVLLSRAAVVYGLPMLLRRRRRARLPLSWRHVLFWGGLRGAVSLALALGLPVALAEREMLLSMAFGVMLFSLLIQGTTVQFLLRWLQIFGLVPHRVEREMRLGRLFAARVGLQRLQQLHQEGLITDEMWAGLYADYAQDRVELAEGIHNLLAEHAELEREMLIQARREALRAERGALNDALRRGLISDGVYEDLSANLDRRLEALDRIQEAGQSWTGQSEV